MPIASETMDRYARTAAVRRAGIQQKAIAEKLGVSESLVSQVIAGKRRNLVVERAIARALDRQRSEVFPARPEAA